MAGVTQAPVKSAKATAALASVGSNSALVVLKLTIGLFIGSVAVISEAIHSGIDLAASIIAYFSVKAADVPPDEDHPYGHGKIESISGTVEALLIFLAGGWIIYEAIHAFLAKKEIEMLGWGIGVMAISALANTLVARYLFIVAHREDSVALKADAHHLSVDVYTSLGVFAGLILVKITGMRIFDPIAALVVGCLILHTAYSITREAVLPLLDTALPKEDLDTLIGTLKADSRVKGWHRLRTRKSGSQRHIDFHLLLDDGLTLSASHAISHEVKDAIKAALPNSRVVIHMEPVEEELQKHPPLGGPDDPSLNVPDA